MKKTRVLQKCTELDTVKFRNVRFHPKAREEISSYPEKIKKDIGYLLYLLQVGSELTMPHSRMMNAIDSGVSELRVRESSGAYRVFYCMKSEFGILVFHAFKKKTAKTPPHEIDLARKRMKEMLGK